MTIPRRKVLSVSLHDVKVETLSGDVISFGDFAGQAVLVVNVASKCGLTPQYTGLEALHEELAPRGFTVLGVPCNQFKGQEPGTAEEIQEFCSTTYGVTFPLLAKTDVLGEEQHPLYAELTRFPAGDDRGQDVIWNFEKFLVSPAGEVVGRFRPQVLPDDPALRAAIEAVLPR
jgi:glutathione peroxidase